MRRFIWLPLAGALLTGGAAVGAAAPNLVADATGAVTQVPGRPAALLEEVLADLVEQGVINQEQSDAITGALKERVEEERTEWQAWRDELRAMVEQVRGFLEDDVITAEEVASLPDGGLKSALETLLVDGEITRGQLRQLRSLVGGHAGGPGHHFRGRPDFAPGPPWRELPSEQPTDTTD